MLDHYLHTAYTANRLVHPARDTITLSPPQPGTAPEEMADDQQAWQWLEAECSVLLAAITLADGQGFDRHACQLPWTLMTFFDRRGQWHDSLAAQTVSLAAAARLGDRAVQARSHRVLGVASGRLGSYPDAHAHLNRALALHRDLGNQAGESATLDSLGHAYHHLGRHREAIECYRQALALLRTIRYRWEEACTLSRLGDTQHAAGDDDAARDAWEQAQALFDDLQHPDAEQVRRKLKALTG